MTKTKQKNETRQKRFLNENEISSVIIIPTTKFEYWFRSINMIFNLTDKEIMVAAALVRYYFKIAQQCDDELMRNYILFSSEYRKAIKDEIGVSDNYFDVLLNKLRAHNIIKIVDEKNILNKQVIPKFTKDKSIALLIYFENDEK